ncbi:hypothetical protein [Rhodococcus sp. IEGM 1379]|uniref:hypothetical protein n=1 Tax=Rhodococcus sp. IEGM 1379 TaxID=3047086 RepID=UPI0024B7BFDE|nr:hypothetical protein [Rhodococcus sp. IEGM 1379]MDI9915388.1 hypothetical protein [Rhodococcus sp. IEGM 1379]
MSILVDPPGVSERSGATLAPPLSTLAFRRIAAQHVSVDGRCDACGFRVSERAPLCPDAAIALHELSRRDGKWARRVQLFDRDTIDLLRIAGAHHQDRVGRCARCGFVFTTDCELCPTLRAVRRELEVRGVVPIVGAERGKGLCAGKARSWEMDGRTAAQWRRAITSCEACPLLAQCRSDADSAIKHGDGPRRMVLAGNAYDNHGNVIDRDRLELYASLTTVSHPRSRAAA